MVLFLYIPIGQLFESDHSIANRCCDRRHFYLIWDRLATRYPSFQNLDLLDELPRRYNRELVYKQMIIHHQGQPTGHFTPLGNSAVAEIIAERLRQDAPIAQPRGGMER
jgi:hypothetical protein